MRGVAAVTRAIENCLGILWVWALLVSLVPSQSNPLSLIAHHDSQRSPSLLSALPVHTPQVLLNPGVSLGSSPGSTMSQLCAPRRLAPRPSPFSTTLDSYLFTGLHLDARSTLPWLCEPWASGLTFLGLNLLICKMGIITTLTA